MEQDLNAILSSPQAEGILRNKGAVEALMRSDEARRLMERLSRSAGDALQGAAQSAVNGDAAPLMAMVEALMRDPESAKLAQQLDQRFQ